MIPQAPFYYAIASRGRHETISEDTIKVIGNVGIPVFVFVNDEKEAENYRRALFGSKQKYLVVVTGVSGITNNRNFMLDYFGFGTKIVMMCDDVQAVLRLDKSEKKLEEMSSHDIFRFCSQSFDECSSRGKYLWGVYPVSNAFYMKKQVTEKAFVIATFCGVVVSKIRFDPRVLLKEDYDFSIAHAVKNAMIRKNFVCVKARHYTNSGGCVDYRNSAVEQKSISVLKEKYPEIVKDNPRRPNEILLRFPK